MAYTQYWSERDSFFRRQERVLRNELLHEVYYNHAFSVFRLRNGKYAVTDYRKDPTDGYDVIYESERQAVLYLIEDPDQWQLFAMKAQNEGRMIKLDTNGFTILMNLQPERYEPDQEETDFRNALQQAWEKQDEIRKQENIVGTPEWRRSVEREVHALAEQDRARMAGKPAIARLFAEPSVRKRLKNEKDYVYKEQNRRILEAQEAEKNKEAGVVSKSTLIAGVVSVVGILLFYLLIYLRLPDLQFLPALICGIVSIVILVRDPNCDTKNMNARLPVWIISIICFVLGLTALVSMFS